MFRQRVYGICQDYEDLNNHKSLQTDHIFRNKCGTDIPLASTSTLCSLENKADRKPTLEVHKIIVEKFIESFNQPPKELIPDSDATDDLVNDEKLQDSFMATMATIASCRFMSFVKNIYLRLISDLRSRWAQTMQV